MQNKIVSLSKTITIKQRLARLMETAIDFMHSTSIGRELRAETIRELRDGLIKGNNENIRAVLIYGSTAKGIATPKSDIDVMVVLNDTDDNPLVLSKEVSTFFDVLLSNTTRKTHFPPHSLVLKCPDKSMMVIISFFVDFNKVTNAGIHMYDPRGKGRMIGDEWIIVARTANEEESIKLQLQAKIHSVQLSMQH